MSDFFAGNTNFPKFQLTKVAFATIATATLANPYMFFCVPCPSPRTWFFKNTTDVILRILVVNPSKPTSTPQTWLELEPGESFSQDMAPSYDGTLPIGMRLYVCGVSPGDDRDGGTAQVAVAPTTGRLKFYIA